MQLTPAESAPPPSRARFAALAALLVATFCFVTTENLPSGLLPLIAADLHTSLSATGLLVSGYGLTVAVVSVPLTRATRNIPRRYVLTGLLAVFVAATLASALATGYPVMLAGRVVTALAHAVFWAVAVVTATSLFAPQVRGRVVTAVFGASALATVVGVPVGAWIGAQSGWRVAFFALTVLGLVAMVVVAVSLPNVRPGEEHTAHAAAPDTRRYTLLLVATALAITGLSVSSTYTVPFLTDVTGFSEDAVGPLLLVRGAAGVVVLAVGATLLDRWPRAAMTVPTWLLALSSIGLYLCGRNRVVSTLLLALFGAAMMLMITAMANRVLHVAPGRTEVSAAAHSAVFNASVAAGALVGALLLPSHGGLRNTALVAGVLVAAAAAALVLEPHLKSRRPARGRRPVRDHRPAAPARSG
ncbi:MFS transporter [Cellulomonas sp. URHB0016]